MRRAWLVAAVVVLLGLTTPTLALAGNGNGNGPKDTREVGKDIHLGKKKVVPPTPAQEAAIQATASATTGTTPPLGTQRLWLVLDDTAHRYGFSNFTLKAVGPHYEVWQQNNLNFPTGDCRNDGVRNAITPPGRAARKRPEGERMPTRESDEELGRLGDEGDIDDAGGDILGGDLGQVGDFGDNIEATLPDEDEPGNMD
jgi:hypothetical protein